jgi:hypothetical protein
MNKNKEQNWQTHKNDELDRALDAALAKYATVDPRSGLEQRILARLQRERGHVPARAWWPWGVAAAFATVVFVILGLAWTGIRRAPTIAIHPPIIEPKVTLPAPQIVSSRPPAPDSTAKPAPHHPKLTSPAIPKLDQFPSPQPLSDQERILASYVEAFPDTSVLLARARTQALRRDQIEDMRSYPASEGTSVPRDEENNKMQR